MKQVVISLFVLLQMACQSPPVFEQYTELPDECWEKQQMLKFNALLPDSGSYRISCHIRHTTRYKMTNLWCFISANDSTTTRFRDTVNLNIAESDGRWLGKGGHLKHITQEIQHNPVILPRGFVTFIIQQGMPMQALKGIRSIGIKIEKTEEQKM